MTERIPASRLQQDLELVGGRLRRRAADAPTPAPRVERPAPPDGHAPGPLPLPGWPLRRPLKPEEKLQREIVAVLRPELAPRGIMIAGINAEVAMAGDIGRTLQALRNAMGGVPGLVDLLVIYPGGRSLLMEAKRPAQPRLQPVDGQLRVRTVGAGQLTELQRQVRDWANRWAVPWALVRSVDEARAAIDTYRPTHG